MVPGGSYSNNLPSPLSVQLQLCLRIAAPPGHHSCHNSDTFFPFPGHAGNTLCIPKLLRRSQCTPLGCPFSHHHLEIGKNRNKRRNFSVQDWEGSSRGWMLGLCSAHSPAQPRAEMWAQTARGEPWLAAVPVPGSGEQGFAQGHAKPPSAPSLFPHHPRCSKSPPELQSLLQPGTPCQAGCPLA